ncbi:MAG: hypothetical protein ACLSB9_14490 [Hydrogeniiclostridium mannosilyticum]
MFDLVDTVAGESGSFVVPKGREGDVASEVSLAEKVPAPVEEGQQLGKITYSLTASSWERRRSRRNPASMKLLLAAASGCCFRLYCAAEFFPKSKITEDVLEKSCYLL